MKKTILIAAFAASAVIPATAAAGDYLNMFEGKPNKTVTFSPNAAPHMQGQPQTSAYQEQSTNYQQMPMQSGAPMSMQTYSQQSYAPPAPTHSYVAEPINSAPTYSTYDGSSQSHIAPVATPTGQSHSLYTYRGSNKRYDQNGKRVQ